MQRLKDGPWLQAPLGCGDGSAGFPGFFSHNLLIGNRFGGTIAAFDTVTGKLGVTCWTLPALRLRSADCGGWNSTQPRQQRSRNYGQSFDGSRSIFRGGHQWLCGWIVRDFDAGDGGTERRRSRGPPSPKTPKTPARESRGVLLFIAEYFHLILSYRTRLAAELSGDSCMLRMYQWFSDLRQSIMPRPV